MLGQLGALLKFYVEKMFSFYLLGDHLLYFPSVVALIIDRETNFSDLIQLASYLLIQTPALQEMVDFV